MVGRGQENKTSSGHMVYKFNNGAYLLATSNLEVALQITALIHSPLDLFEENYKQSEHGLKIQ